MKVSELIEKLKELDQDKYIVVGAYEGGVDFPERIINASIILNQNTEWYYGAHEVNYNSNDWNAYIIEGK